MPRAQQWLRPLRTPRARLGLAVLALALLPLSPFDNARPTGPADAAAQEVARASCGPGDRPELPGALQGQVAAAVAFRGTRCNLSLVGSYLGPGSTWVGAAHEDCAYYPTVGDGVVVLDVSDPQQPRVTATLRSPGMMRTWESLKVNDRRELLAGTAYDGNALDVYDVHDCRHPQLLASVALPDLQGHEAAWAPDGLTFYVTSRSNRLVRDFGFLPVDLTEPRDPRPLPRWDTPGWGTTHGLSLSPDGNRMYLTVPNGFGHRGSGVAVLDVSAVQRRDQLGQVRVVSTAGWPDGHETQMTIPLTIHDRPHLLVVDESGSHPLSEGRVGCRYLRDESVFGYPRLLDLSDEAAPRLVTRIRLQVQEPRNCAVVLRDRVHSFTYSSHYCSVDRAVEPQLLVCATFGSGVRVFDLRDVEHLREVAYFNPPPRPGRHSEKGRTDGGTDWATSPPVLRLDRGELWAQFQDNGLQVLRLDPSVLALLE